MPFRPVTLQLCLHSHTFLSRKSYKFENHGWLMKLYHCTGLSFIDVENRPLQFSAGSVTAPYFERFFLQRQINAIWCRTGSRKRYNVHQIGICHYEQEDSSCEKKRSQAFYAHHRQYKHNYDKNIAVSTWLLSDI